MFPNMHFQNSSNNGNAVEFRNSYCNGLLDKIILDFLTSSNENLKPTNVKRAIIRKKINVKSEWTQRGSCGDPTIHMLFPR